MPPLAAQNGCRYYPRHTFTIATELIGSLNYLDEHGVSKTSDDAVTFTEQYFLFCPPEQAGK